MNQQDFNRKHNNGVSSEENVKDDLQAILNIKDNTQNLGKDKIDFYVDGDFWFECKNNLKKIMIEAMFAELGWYFNEMQTNGKVSGSRVSKLPKLLGVFSPFSCALIKCDHFQNIINEFKKNGRQFEKNANSEVFSNSNECLRNFIMNNAEFNKNVSVFNSKTNLDEFKIAFKEMLNGANLGRIIIGKDNMLKAYQQWNDIIGDYLKLNESDAQYMQSCFFADICSINQNKENVESDVDYKKIGVRRFIEDGNPVWIVNGNEYSIQQSRWKRFWQMYQYPVPNQRREIIERRDTLLPKEFRAKTGSFFTAYKTVELDMQYLNEYLGDGWEEKYIIIDMCAGTANLEFYIQNKNNIWVSDLQQANVDIMKATSNIPKDHIFQYDYLNDDIEYDENGDICFDYSLTNKVPDELRKIINEGKKDILVLINPPYAESRGGDYKDGKNNKNGISFTKMNAFTINRFGGKCANELYMQFFARIEKEFSPNNHLVLAQHSTTKHLCGSGSEEFRKNWTLNYEYGYAISSSTFNTNGKFPICFIIWDNNRATRLFPKEIEIKWYNSNWEENGTKCFYNCEKGKNIRDWLNDKFDYKAAKKDIESIKFSTTYYPLISSKEIVKIHKDAFGYIYIQIDMSHANQVRIQSGIPVSHGVPIFKENIDVVLCILSVMNLFQRNEYNERDQFCWPSKEPDDEMYNDCIIWSLFNGANYTTSANNIEWLDKKWKLKNNFIPFPESEVGCKMQYESNFMVKHLANKTFSKEAQDVLDEAKQIYKFYHRNFDKLSKKIIDEFHLDHNAGWYQIKNAIEALNEDANSEDEKFDFSNFKSVYQKLMEKLKPKVYEYGFLK